MKKDKLLPKETKRILLPLKEEMDNLDINNISDDQWERMFKWAHDQDRKYKKLLKEMERKHTPYTVYDTCYKKFMKEKDE